MNHINRRAFLRNSGLAGACAFIPQRSFQAPSQAQKLSALNTWDEIHAQFQLNRNRIQMAQMLFACHPKPVRDAIERHRKELDLNPVEYLEERLFSQDEATRQSAAKYLNVRPEEIALTDSTTMGLSVLFHGLNLQPGDEILTSTHDHYSTEMSLEYSTKRNGATIKRIPLYRDASKITVDEVISALTKNITSATRIIAVTWVHSCTGVKLPIKEMSEAIRNVNSQRSDSTRVYFCVDGVHGFGNQHTDLSALGCDFFAAGTHKWLFGPRGTGILWGKKDAWKMITPTIPSFGYASYYTWMGMDVKDQMTFADAMTPGGFHSFEHRWALKEAFDFNLTIGQQTIQSRTEELNLLLKEGLASVTHVKLITPMRKELSAGINCFEIDGMPPQVIVQKLAGRNIIASSSPYRISYARLTPCMLNTEEEVKKCIREVENLKT